MADPDEYQRQQKQLHLLHLFPEALQARQRGSSVLQTLCRKTDLLHGEAEYHAEKLQRPPSGELDRSRKRIMTSSGNFSMVCRVCSKEFPSGRALGGHMRVHGGLLAGPIRAAERSHHDRKQVGLIRNYNATEQDRDSGFKEGLRSGSGLQSSKVFLEKGLEGEYEEPFMEEEEEEEDVGAFEVAATVSSESGYDDDKLFCDDQFRMISRSHSNKEPRLGSLKFISNLESQQNRELLGDGLKVSSESKRNSLYELRHNPKRSRLLTDKEFDSLEVLSGNAAMAAFVAKRLSSSSPERTRACFCPVCDKEFWSQKALFGHMRCHPEREWRGIQPPETTSQLQRGAIRFVMKNQPAASLSSFAEESEIDIQSDLENKEEAADKKEGEEKPEVCFKIKVAPRTQNAKEPVQEEGKPRLHSAIKEVDIKNLTNTAPWPTSKRSKRRRSSGLQEMSSTPETVLTSETTEVEEEHEKEDTEKHQKAKDEAYLACCLLLLSAGQTDAGPAFFDSARAQEESEKTDFESGDDDLESKEDDQLGAYDDRYSRSLMIASNSDIKYECSTCKRCFNSPQALGGHRASHKKMKGCYAREEVPVVHNWKDSTEEDPELNKWQPGTPQRVMKFEGGRVSGREEEKKNEKIKGHECSICHRIFPTGQALGGHKRCHWISEKTQDCTASAASNNDRQLSLSLIEGGKSTTLKEEGMGIDLNLPAPFHEEEDEASYSHNVGYGYDYGCGHGSAELRLLPEKLVNATGVAEEKEESLVEIANKSSLDVMSPVNWRVMDCFGGHGELFGTDVRG